jgi:hypothetical protein
MILPGEALDVLESSPNSHLSVLPSSGRTKDRRVPSCRVSVPSLNSAGTVPFQSYVAFGAPAAAEGTRTVARDQQNDDSSLWPPEPDSIYPAKAQEGNRHEAESQLRRRKGRSSQGRVLAHIESRLLYHPCLVGRHEDGGLLPGFPLPSPKSPMSASWVVSRGSLDRECRLGQDANDLPSKADTTLQRFPHLAKPGATCITAQPA